MQGIPELSGLEREYFENKVLPAYRPIVARGVVADWPLVAQGRMGLEPTLQYLMTFDCGAAVDAVLARPDALRALTYAPGLEGFNFLHDKRPLEGLFDQLWRYSHFPDPPCLAIQSALVPEVLPGLERANACPLLDSNIVPRAWIGNRVTVPAHFDDSHNLACVVAGRRRFTLLPPQCAPLLYMGPPDYAPTSAPMSIVPCLQAADPERYPLVAEALKQAFVAELDAGDALYIPPLWFHQVESLDPHLNMLLNYWWRPAPAPGRTDDLHRAALHLAMQAFRHLPPGELEGWKALFAHYVFGAPSSSLDYLPEHKRGLLGAIDAALDEASRKDVIGRLGG